MKCRNFIKIIPILALCLASGSVLAADEFDHLDVYNTKAVVTKVSEAENMIYLYVVDLPNATKKEVASFTHYHDGNYIDLDDASCTGPSPSDNNTIALPHNKR